MGRRAWAGAADSFGNSALPLVPVQHEGWAGRPAITGNPLPHRRFRLTSAPVRTDSSLRVEASDADLSLSYELHLTEHGVIRARAGLRSTAPWTVAALRCLLPLPDEATELLDFSGRWS